MHETALVAPADLLLDADNPRIPREHQGQRELLRALAKKQDKKLLTLAEDIVAYGLSPAELPIVMPSADTAGRFTVLDGNRRLTALRSLESPEILVDVLSSGLVDRIRKISAKYQQSPIGVIECVVYRSREEADHWITLRHQGPQEGAGTIEWGSDEKARHLAGIGGPIELHTRLLNFLEDSGHLTRAERQRVTVTNLKRLVDNPTVRARLGIELRNDGALTFRDEAVAVNGLLYIIKEIADKKIKVGDIYTAEQRAEYARTIPETIAPPITLGNTASEPSHEPKARTKHVSLARRKQDEQRDRLIPSICFLNITQTRIKRIETELRSLSLKDYPNSVSVLFRVFLELSVDTYIENNALPPLNDPSLGSKTEQVVNNLVTNRRLTSQEAVPVRRACQKDSFLAPSVKLMHQFVHNPHVFPAPGDLRAYWDGLQPFVVALWTP